MAVTALSGQRWQGLSEASPYTVPTTTTGYKTTGNMSGDSSQFDCVYVSPDGTKMFITSGALPNNDTVVGYTLGTPYDVSTKTQDQTYSVAVQTASPWGIYFSDNGRKMFVVGLYAGSSGGANHLWEYELDVAWVITSGVTQTLNADISTLVGSTVASSGLTFNSDGTKFYIHKYGDPDVYEFECDAFELTNVEYNDVTKSFSGITEGYDCAFMNDGISLILSSKDPDDGVLTYTLGTAYDLSTAGTTATSTFDTSSVSSDVIGVSATKNYLYTTDQNGYAVYRWTGGFTADKTTVTDVPVGSEFEQTDDYKNYQLMPPTIALPTGLTASSYAINTTGGGASYMRVNQSTDLLLSTDDMTWSFWFYPTVIPSGEAGFFKPNGGTLSVWCYLREVAQKMAIGLKGSGGTVYAYGDTTPTVNKWNLATISWEYSSETVKIYMNDREETVTKTGTSGALSGNFDDFVFFSNTTTGSEDLDGYVAEVAMWEDYWSDDTNHNALWNSYDQSTNAGGKSCNDLGTTLNNKLRYFFTGEYANTTGDVILNQATGTDSESAIKGTPTNLSRLDGGNSWVERGST